MNKQEKAELYNEIYFLESEARHKEDLSDSLCSSGITPGTDEDGKRTEGYNVGCQADNLYSKIERLKIEFQDKTGEDYENVFY